MRPSVRLSFPSNRRIVMGLLDKFNRPNASFVAAVAQKLTSRYDLSYEDRADLVAHANFKLAKVDWRQKLANNRAWIRSRYRNRVRFTVEEVVSILNGYAHCVVQNSLREHARSIKQRGLTGIGTRPLNSIPHHDDSDDIELSSDHLEYKAAGSEIFTLAKEILAPDEFEAVCILFGFDGGHGITPAQAAREMGISRRRLAELSAAAMLKLRGHLVLSQ